MWSRSRRPTSSRPARRAAATSSRAPRCSAGGRFSRPGSRPAPASAEEHEQLQRRARAEISEAGQYLAYEDGAEVKIVPLAREWTRIGRSLAADVRFDDPTVSRRHALIVRQHDGVRVLDDRSLNGVFVNGQRVEWQVLHDGDEIVVGRYRLHFLEQERTTAAGSASGGQR